MVNIRKVWLVTLNRDEEDAGVDEPNSINLSVDINGEDRFENDYFPSEKRACGNFDEGFASPKIDEIFDSNSLTNSSIRLNITGEDAWSPDQILILGITAPSEGDSRVLPLAVEVDQQITLSTDPRDGNPAHPSMPIRIVGSGNVSTLIQRVLLLVQTYKSEDSGTDDPIEIDIKIGNVSVAQREIIDTHQDDFEEGTTNWYFVNVNTPFTKAQVQSDGKITMTIKGKNAWNPKRIFVYGFDTPEGRPTQIVDLVSFPVWTGGKFSRDPDEGVESSDLALS